MNRLVSISLGVAAFAPLALFAQSFLLRRTLT
jgi:hypothetical protein